MVNTFNEENFEEEVLKTEKTVIVDFYADWCMPCKMMSPIIDSIAEESISNLKVGKINVDENPNLAEKFGVMSIPTLIIMKDGNEVNKSIGLIHKEDLEKLMDFE